MAQFSFDTGSVAPRENNFEVLPAGVYTAQVIESEVVPLKSGNGQALKLTLEILSDGYRHRKVWARLNVRHTNPKAETIAQQQLRELCDSIGLARMQDTVELHQKPFSVKLKVRVDETGQYEPSNEVVGFKAAAGVAVHGSPIPARPAGAPIPVAANTTPGGSTPPWAKKAA